MRDGEIEWRARMEDGNGWKDGMDRDGMETDEDMERTEEGKGN